MIAQSIYTERENILPHHAEWLDGCGAVYENRKSLKKHNIYSKYIIFNGSNKMGFTDGYDPNYWDDYTHIPTGTEFCERVAEILGLPKPTFEVEPIKGIAIEVSRLSEEDKKWLIQNTFNAKEVLKEAIAHGKLVCSNFYPAIGFGDKQYLETIGFTITDSPTVFMEYVAQQTGKEYKPESQIVDEETVGNAIKRLGMNDQIADEQEERYYFGEGNKIYDRKKPEYDSDAILIGEPDKLYPHKTYRILDSLDDWPLDKRTKLSEWIPPFQKDVLFIIKGKAFVAHIWKLQESIFALGGSNELIRDLDGEWMRIV